MVDYEKKYYKYKSKNKFIFKYPLYKYSYTVKKSRFDELINNFQFVIEDNKIEENWKKNEELNNTTDFFTEECRIQCKFAKHNSPEEYWHKNKSYLLKKTHNIAQLRDLIYKKSRMCNNFRISVALTILKIFNATKWLDISAGWGDRLIAAIGSNVERYVSADPNTCLFEGYDNIKNTLSPSKKDNYIIYNDGFENIDLKGETFDLVFSSPPFFDLEIYSHEKTDSLVKYDNVNNWYNRFLIPSLDKALTHLEKNGHMVLYIDEGIKTDYIDEMKIYLNNKMTKKETIYYYYPNRMIMRSLYVWQKN
jgi:16S rRNA G966 N2-methylase RsmD